RQARTRWMAAHGHQLWPTSPDRPQLVLVIDELTGVIRALGGVDELNALASEARKAGITLLMATQRVTAEALGGATGLPSQCRAPISLRLSRRREAAAIFGDDRVAEGWWADRLRERGAALVWSDGELQVPTPYGTYLVPAGDARRFAQEASSRA